MADPHSTQRRFVPDERTMERFWSFVNKTDTCWLWTGLICPYGYGRFFCHSINSRNAIKAHRFAFTVFRRELSSTECVLHRCDVRECVNPEHLFTGTRSDNNRDMFAKRRAWQAQATHCASGHEYTPENTDSRDGRRYCRQCGRDSTQKRRREKRDGIAAHRKVLTYATRRIDGVLCEVAVPRSKALANTHRRVGPFGVGRWARKLVALEQIGVEYEPRHSGESYDTLQAQAVLVQCSRCPAWYYATNPQTPEICSRCRENEKQEAVS